MWDPATGQTLGEPLRLTDNVDPVRAVALGWAAGRDVIVSANSLGVRVWDAATGEPLGPADSIDAVQAAAVGQIAGRDIIVSGNKDGTVEVWDAATLQRVAQQQFPDPIRSLSLAGQRLAVAQWNDIVVLKINPAILAAAASHPGQDSGP